MSRNNGSVATRAPEEQRSARRSIPEVEDDDLQVVEMARDSAAARPSNSSTPTAPPR